MTTLRDKFYNFKARQRQTRVKVDLTFDQWETWWEETGHLHERGNRPGKWIMHRIDQTGPYSIDNIECVPFETIGKDLAERNKQRWKQYRLNKQNLLNNPQP